MKKKLLSLALALALCLGLLPTAVFAAEAQLPDWYFLFAIFKNVDADGIDKDGKELHTTYTMTPEEINVARDYAREFEAYMNQVGVMRAHVDVVEIDEAVTELEEYSGGSWISPKQAAPLLKSKVDLDQYDHVVCMVSLNIGTSYGGLTGGGFENGTGQSCINFVNQDVCLNIWAVEVYPWAPGYPVHEFLHVMEQKSQKWGWEYNLHDIMEHFYVRVNGEFEECYTDIIRNQAKGTAGTGVHPAAWQYSPCVLRNLSEWTIPSSITAIGAYAFQNCSNLTKLTIPGSIADVTKYAFLNCTGLTEVTILPGVISIGDWAFGCDKDRSAPLEKVSIPASVTSIGYAAFWNTGVTDVYYSGTEEQWKAIQIGEFNDALTGAVIHYNASRPQQPAGNAASPTNDKLEVNGAAANPTVYKIDGSNYFKIRDVAALLNGTEKQFSVGYDGEKNAVTATPGQGYDKLDTDLAGAPAGGDQTAEPSNDTIYINGEKAEVEVYKIGGSNYFKLRDLGQTLNFYVGWSAERGMYIETDKPYAE